MERIIQKQAMYRFFQVNRDIFFRTLCLVVVTLFFTSAGASQGEICISRKHLAHATIHSVFLHHGRICLCR